MEDFESRALDTAPTPPAMWYRYVGDTMTKIHEVKETSRLLETRVKEHLSRNSSAVHEHCQLTGHSVDSSKTKVLATESNTFKRCIREAIEIKLREPALNRDNGFELARIYDTILAPSGPLYNPSQHSNLHCG